MSHENAAIEGWEGYLPVTSEELDEMYENGYSGWNAIWATVGVGHMSENARENHLIRMRQDCKYAIAMVTDGLGLPRWLHHGLVFGDLPENGELASLVSIYRNLVSQ